MGWEMSWGDAPCWGWGSLPRGSRGACAPFHLLPWPRVGDIVVGGIGGGSSARGPGGTVPLVTPRAQGVLLQVWQLWAVNKMEICFKGGRNKTFACTSPLTSISWGK